MKIINKEQKVAIIHDFVGRWGGATRVLVELFKIYPEADLYTLFIEKQDKKNIELMSNIKGKIVIPWWAKISLFKKIPGYQMIALFNSRNFWERIDLSNYDLVISSTFGFGANSVFTLPDIPHVCYVHTTLKNLYGERFLTGRNFKLRDGLLAGFLQNRRIWDVVSSVRPNLLVANSIYTRGKIKNYWGRESVVIYPPINNKLASIPEKKNKKYYLYFGRVVIDKGLELIIRSFNKSGKKLLIVGEGEGKYNKYCKKIAKKNIKFTGFVDDEKLGGILGSAKALIFGSKCEDFGMVIAEVLALGIPVIAYNRGGAREIVTNKRNGILFNEYSIKGLNAAIEEFEKMRIKRKDCKESVKRFDRKRFKKEFLSVVSQYEKSGC